jgi:hypothetical protein
MVVLQNAHKDRVMGFKTKAVWFWVIWGHPLFWETPTLRIIIPLGGEQVGLVFSVWRGTSQDGLANVNGFPPGIPFGRRYERGFKKLACHSWRVWVDPHSWFFLTSGITTLGCVSFFKECCRWKQISHRHIMTWPQTTATATIAKPTCWRKHRTVHRHQTDGWQVAWKVAALQGHAKAG